MGRLNWRNFKGEVMKVLSLFDGKYDVCSDGYVWSNVGKKETAGWQNN